VYHGADHIPAASLFQSPHKMQASMPFSRYLLYVGNRSHYKGFDDLLSAFSRVSSLHNSLGLICVGVPFSGRELYRIQKFNLQGRVLALQVDDSRLLDFYRHAQGFVYPSWREGFGLPILEAMRACCPVVCSDIPSSREVAENHALFFRAGDQADLQAVLQHLLTLNPIVRSGLVCGAQGHASRFTWKEAARRTCDIYLDVLARCTT
jgi:glycosyltransferase involved in cell wall biosynthesis